MRFVGMVFAAVFAVSASAREKMPLQGGSGDVGASTVPAILIVETEPPSRVMADLIERAVETEDSATIADYIVSVICAGWNAADVRCVLAAAYGKSASLAADVIRRISDCDDSRILVGHVAPFVASATGDIVVPAIVRVEEAAGRENWYDKYSFNVGSRLWAVVVLAQDRAKRGEPTDDLKAVFDEQMKKWFSEME